MDLALALAGLALAGSAAATAGAAAVGLGDGGLGGGEHCGLVKGKVVSGLERWLKWVLKKGVDCDPFK